MSEETQPLLNGDDFKLALFAYNVTGGLSMTTADGAMLPTWQNQVRLSQMADQAGFDALLSATRWTSMGGESDWNGTVFETMTWATGIAAATQHAMVIATVNVNAIHPVIAAKQAVTIDHVSGGRFGFNLVAGWNQQEMDVFGYELLGHEDRYGKADEWMGLVSRMWTEDEPFDFQGDYYSGAAILSKPKPVQARPVIINAAGSARGQRFVADHADVCFTTSELGGLKDKVLETRTGVRERRDREIKVLGCVTVVCRDTEEEARRHWNYCVREKGDRETAFRWASQFNKNSQSFDEATKQRVMASLDNAIAGLQTPQAIGTPEQVAAMIIEMAAAGLDGVTISFITDWEEELERFVREVLPLLEQAGLRKPFDGLPSTATG